MFISDNFVFTAPWIFPITAPPIKDGAIVINSDRIVEVGSRTDILSRFGNFKTNNLDGILIPPLVNCHIHLELSHLHNISRPLPESSMVAWIEELLHRRQNNEDTESKKTINRAINNVIEDQYRSGVVLMADIQNVPDRHYDPVGRFQEIFSIHEMLAPTSERVAAALAGLDKISAQEAVSPHAPYSCSAGLITSLHERAFQNKHIFSIHLAESSEEIDFICNRKGGFRDFLERRSSWEADMIPLDDFFGSVDYLDKLEVLDERTLCVHCVHLQENDLQLLSEKNAKVCLCPGSNAFLHVGTAPLESMLRYGLLPAIGTDSLASNDMLDMWREMKLLRKNFPSLDPHIILSMATLGGAKALHRNNDFGSLQKGRKPVFLEILIDNPGESTDQKIADILTSKGRPKTINWVTPPEN